MSAPTTCPTCHSPLPADAPEGLCPRCLVLRVVTEGAGDTPAAGAPPAAEELGRLLPGYRFVRLLGQGGMGVVYLARQEKLERDVAIKLLSPELDDEPDFAERFAREARTLASLSHTHVVTVHDYGQVGGLCYLVMEYVDGVNLRDLLVDGHLEPARALRIVPQVCAALEYAHEEGVVHRDIKPENILIDRRGAVKIADFGLAKMVGDRAEERKLTGSGQAMGTVHYMAPEQLERPLEVDHRADIYSLGVVFYELLTGELPIGRFAAPSDRAPVDSRLDEVVLKSLEKEPNQRYQRASEVQLRVEEIGDGAAPEPREPVDVVGRIKIGVVVATLLAAAGFFLFLVVDAGILFLDVDAELLRAADSGSNGRVREMIERGADVEARDAATGATPLILSADSSDRHGVEALLGAGADVEARDASGSTALIRAVRVHSAPTAVALLEAGADPDARDGGGRTALSWAVGGMGRSIVRPLLAFGADPDLADESRWTPLHYAAQNSMGEAIELMVSEGADVDLRNDAGETALHLAARGGHVFEIEALLTGNPSLDLADDEGRTALMQAAASGSPSAAMLIHSAGADVTIRDLSEWTALTHAAFVGAVECLELLVKYYEGGATLAEDLDVALAAAHAGNQVHAARFLIREGAVPGAEHQLERAFDLASQGLFAESCPLLEECVPAAAEARGPWRIEHGDWEYEILYPALVARLILAECQLRSRGVEAASRTVAQAIDEWPAETGQAILFRMSRPDERGGGRKEFRVVRSSLLPWSRGEAETFSMWSKRTLATGLQTSGADAFRTFLQ